MILLLLQVVVSDDAVQPKAAIAPDGSIHVVMIRGGNIVVSSSADGTTFSESVAIDAKGKAKGGMQRGPRIGVDKKGALVVTAPLCFDEAEFKKPYPTNELWIVRSSDGGKTWTKPAQVNDSPKTAAEALHWMAVAPDGDAHVAFLDFREGKTNCLWYARAGSDNKVGKNVKLTGPVCECCAPGMACDEKGNPYIVVREGKKTNRGVLYLYSKDGGKSFKTAPGTVNAGPTGIDQ
jgi:hypothetical protein